FAVILIAHTFVVVTDFTIDCQQSAVWAKRYGLDRRCFDDRSAERTSRFDIPEPQSLIPTAGNKKPAAWVENYTRYIATMPIDRFGRYRITEIPQFNRIIFATGGQQFAIRAEG